MPILLVGGVTTGYTFTSSAELYDPARNNFAATGSMSVPRKSLVLAGGHTGRHAEIQLYASAERYDAARGVFTTTRSMVKRRHKQAAIALPDGRVLITGGTDERDDQGQYRDAEVFESAWLYTPR